MPDMDSVIAGALAEAREEGVLEPQAEEDIAPTPEGDEGDGDVDVDRKSVV